ncbi:exopolysaccharide biosynthesis polyprenyl glycosylphosphotransferase [Friedmanniella endophytica]|uniref:Exopolysaccharide biosynthesis polyprenyl glycosylphosphotransferase n=1 Tax=Microlunatus kandeliicorticis TaxID=1759536 RepID=A0A7W3IP91_9ACTN|nr:exopolysaccharide biosynthesis polyprenyl glycosylphosphotransferase [Microlunatus kandeliicorticis]
MLSAARAQTGNGADDSPSAQASDRAGSDYTPRRALHATSPTGQIPTLPDRADHGNLTLSPVDLAPDGIETELAQNTQADVVSGAEALLRASNPGRARRAADPVPHAGRNFLSWSRRYIGLTVALDAVLGAIATLVPTLFSSTLRHDSPTTAGLILLGLLAWPLAVTLVRGYHHNQVGFGGEELRGPLRAAVAVVVVGAFTAQLVDGHTLLALLLTAAPLAAVLSLGARFVLRKTLHFTQRQGRNLRRVIVAGSVDSVRALHERLSSESHHGMAVVGACVPVGDADAELDVPVLGDLSSVTRAVREFGCDAVAVTSDDATRNSYLRKIAWSLEGVGVEMLVDPGLVEVAGPRMHIRPILGLPLVHVAQPRFTGWPRVIKRITDVVLTSAGLAVIWPALLVIAIAVKLNDGGPVLFRQTRVGRDGKPFTMLKFRSMVVDAEARKAELMDRNEGHGALFKLARDPRVTRIGQLLRDFSLDELPQLFNVLAGSMSLVGPRPHLASEVAAMPADAVRRSLVTPGLTGLWQVSGRSDLDAAASVRLDLRYVENWSLTLDLLILWKTAFAVLGKRGAR